MKSKQSGGISVSPFSSHANPSSPPLHEANRGSSSSTSALARPNSISVSNSACLSPMPSPLTTRKNEPARRSGHAAKVPLVGTPVPPLDTVISNQREALPKEEVSRVGYCESSNQIT